MAIVSNPSKYWDLFLYGVQEPAPQESIPIPRSILLKLANIKYLDVFRGSDKFGHANKLNLTFEKLNRDEAEHMLFTVGMGVALFLGSYDWFGGKVPAEKEVSRTMVFSPPGSEKRADGTVLPAMKGVVKEMKWTYGSSGIDVEMLVMDPSVVRFFAPITVPIFDAGEYDLESALKSVANYCDMYLYYGIKNDAIGIWAAEYSKTDFTWRNLPPRVKTDKDGSKNTGRNDRPITPFDIVKYLATRYGQTFCVRHRGLYFGAYDGLIGCPSDIDAVEPSKVFQYRNQDSTLKGKKLAFPQLHHLEVESYEQADILEGTDGPNSVSSAVFLNQDNKKGVSVYKRTDKRVPVFQRTASIAVTSKITDRQSYDAWEVKRQLARHEQEAQRQQALQAQKFAAITQVHGAKSPAELEAIISAQEEERAKFAVGIKITGIPGDAAFFAGDVFAFYGLMNVNNVHSGNYVASQVEHEWNAGSSYKMAITGYRPKPAKKFQVELAKKRIARVPVAPPQTYLVRRLTKQNVYDFRSDSGVTPLDRAAAKMGVPAKTYDSDADRIGTVQGFNITDTPLDAPKITGKTRAPLGSSITDFRPDDGKLWNTPRVGADPPPKKKDIMKDVQENAVMKKIMAQMQVQGQKLMPQQ